MKYIVRFTALAVSFLLLISSMGCTTNTVTPSSVSSQPSSSSEVRPQAEDITLDIPYHNFWTWNDLYDYLESTFQSGEFAFDGEKGESIKLYDTDGTTLLSDWNSMLKQNMVVIKYDAAGAVLCRFTVNLTDKPEDEETSSQNESSSSAVSEPTNSSDSSVSGVSSNLSSTVPSEKTVITVSGMGDTKDFKKAVEDFNQQSKTVEVRIADKQGLFTADSLAQLLNQNKAPDLVLMNRREMELSATKGLLAKVSGHKAGELADSLHQKLWNQTKIGNTRYGLPVGCATYALACNEDILYHCQIEMPETFDELLAAAKTVKETFPKVTPLGFATNPADRGTVADQFTMLLWSFGGQVLTADNSAVAFCSESGVKTLQLYQSMQKDGLLGETFDSADFFDGNTAFGIVSSVKYTDTFGKYAKANNSAAPLIMPGEEKAFSFSEIYSYCIPNTGDKDTQKAAYEFLCYFLSDSDYSLDLCKTNDWIPAVTEARNNAYYQTEAWQVFIDAIENARTYPSLDCTNTINGYLSEAVAAALSGADAQSVLEKAKIKTENRLARQ